MSKRVIKTTEFTCTGKTRAFTLSATFVSRLIRSQITLNNIIGHSVEIEPNYKLNEHGEYETDECGNLIITGETRHCVSTDLCQEEVADLDKVNDFINELINAIEEED